MLFLLFEVTHQIQQDNRWYDIQGIQVHESPFCRSNVVNCLHI